MADSPKAAAGGAVAAGTALKGLPMTWVLVLALSVMGLGFVLPAGNAPAPAPAAKLIGAPTGDVLVIRALKVKAPLVSVALSSESVLTPPANPRQVGYWDGSARPGALRGQTLITGHTVHTGGGALDKLGTMRRGEPVTVYRREGGRQVTARYRVTRVADYSKNLLAEQAQLLFGQRGGYGRLVLVTCTGWDGHEYHGNVIVFATPLGSTSRRI